MDKCFYEADTVNLCDKQGISYRGVLDAHDGFLKILYQSQRKEDNASFVDGKLNADANFHLIVSASFFDRNIGVIKSSFKQTILKILMQEFRHSDGSLFCQVENFKKIPSLFFEKDESFVKQCSEIVQNNIHILLNEAKITKQWAAEYWQAIEDTIKNKNKAVSLIKSQEKSKIN